MKSIESLCWNQQQRNAALLTITPFVGSKFDSNVLPFRLDLEHAELTQQQATILRSEERRVGKECRL